MNESSSEIKKRVKIALIDTGVDATHPDFQNAVLTQYCLHGNELKKIKEPEDQLGHGTACASIIHRLEPMAEIVSIQCLNHEGIANGEQILTTLEWCVEQKIDIVNLSFGALSNKLRERFSSIGKKAIKNDILLFAACHDSGYPSMPACLPEYLAVLGKSVKGRYTYFYQADFFIAHGGKQRVGWLAPRFIFAEGTSFATARMSAIAAKIKRKSGLRQYKELVNALIQCAQTKQEMKLPSISRNRAAEYNSPFFPIYNASIYSFTKEMHALLYFRDLTGIQITSITDPPFKQNVHKRVSQLLSLDVDLEIGLDASFEENIKDADTVILSRTSAYETLTQQDCMRRILERSIGCGKNVYSLEYVDVDLYPEIFEMAKEKGCCIRHPMLCYDDLCQSSLYRDMYGHLGNEIPIVGVFGTGPSQGKFSVQLMLRRLFKAKGYTVNNYGTETHCELFGFEGYYPLEMDLSVKFSQQEMLSFIQGDIRRLEIVNHPDILIVGGQSGTIPHSYALKSSEYTLPTLVFLMATLPHAYILTINPQDDLGFIWDTIHVLEGLGKAKVIAIACSRHCKKLKAESGIVCNYKLSEQEFGDLKMKIYHEFGLPMFDVFDIEDAEALFDLVVSFFHSK